ncbi:MAG: hypothetical protein Q8K99_13300 [Actinomycetota bacterium]|nr:hypothetical protein [Actinomycetota bacterium]
MVALEDMHPDVARYELFTGAEARAPLTLYFKLGYRIFRRETVGSGIELVWLEKRRGGALR